MRIRSDTSGIEAMRKQIRQARNELPDITKRAAQRIGDQVSKDLGNASPKGKGGTPPAGDASGSLSQSFKAKSEQQGAGARTTVETRQPTKLKYIREGTGIYGKKKRRIVPTTKLALFWPGAAHPVKSVKGMKANDFVKPVLAKVDTRIKPELDKASQEFMKILEG